MAGILHAGGMFDGKATESLEKPGRHERSDEPGDAIRRAGQLHRCAPGPGRPDARAGCG